MPRTAGVVDPDAVRELLARAGQEIDSGRLPSCQLALARHGELAEFVTLGSATDASRYVVFSITKALTAAAAWLLVGDGRLTPETRVADLVPEFATNGKETVTLEHLLTHTAGFPRAPMHPEEGATREGRLARFAKWRLDWPPGTRTQYHPAAAHWVVAELIERASGIDYRRFVTDCVTTPLRSGLRLGVPVAEQEGVLDVRIIAADMPPHPDVPDVASPADLLRHNEPGVRAVGVPGVGAIGTAADVALFYQALLHNPDGLWNPSTLADATGHVRNVLPDPWIHVPANRTLGLVVAGDDGHGVLREFGRAGGPRAFGAAGIGGQIAWADPDTGLSFCYLTNGLESDLAAAFLRAAAVSTAAAQCVSGH